MLFGLAQAEANQQGLRVLESLGPAGPIYGVEFVKGVYRGRAERDQAAKAKQDQVAISFTEFPAGVGM